MLMSPNCPDTYSTNSGRNVKNIKNIPMTIRVALDLN